MFASHAPAFIGPFPVTTTTSRGRFLFPSAAFAAAAILSYATTASSNIPKSSSAVQLVLLTTSAGRSARSVVSEDTAPSEPKVAVRRVNHVDVVVTAVVCGVGDGDCDCDGPLSINTKLSFVPPPCDEFTTSDPSLSATRVSPPGTT